jgi:hypothetical protein
MSDQLVTPSPSNMTLLSPYHQEHPPTEDYFTYLSNHQQQPIQPHVIHIQASSPPPPQPEISIPEIRLAPPTNENQQMTVPEFMDVHAWSSPLNSPGPSGPRTRGNNSRPHSLAPPPSILSDCDSFVSARQSFLLSPSASFNHPNELLSVLDQTRLDSVPHQHQPTSPISSSPLSEVHPRSNPYPQQPCCEHYKRAMALYSFFNEMKQVLLPTLEGWNEKFLFSRLSSVAAVPLVLIFTLTLPVAEMEEMNVDGIPVDPCCHDDDDDEEEQQYNALLVPGVERTKSYLSVPTSETDIATVGQVVVVDDVDTKQGWHKYLLAAQCVISTTFIVGVFAGKKKKKKKWE